MAPVVVLTDESNRACAFLGAFAEHQITWREFRECMSGLTPETVQLTATQLLRSPMFDATNRGRLLRARDLCTRLARDGRRWN